MSALNRGDRDQLLEFNGQSSGTGAGQYRNASKKPGIPIPLPSNTRAANPFTQQRMRDTLGSTPGRKSLTVGNDHNGRSGGSTETSGSRKKQKTFHRDNHALLPAAAATEPAVASSDYRTRMRSTVTSSHPEVIDIDSPDEREDTGQRLVKPATNGDTVSADPLNLVPLNPSVKPRRENEAGPSTLPTKRHKSKSAKAKAIDIESSDGVESIHDADDHIWDAPSGRRGKVSTRVEGYEKLTSNANDAKEMNWLEQALDKPDEHESPAKHREKGKTKERKERRKEEETQKEGKPMHEALTTKLKEPPPQTARSTIQLSPATKAIPNTNQPKTKTMKPKNPSHTPTKPPPPARTRREQQDPIATSSSGFEHSKWPPNAIPVQTWAASTELTDADMKSNWALLWESDGKLTLKTNPTGLSSDTVKLLKRKVDRYSVISPVAAKDVGVLRLEVNKGPELSPTMTKYFFQEKKFLSGGGIITIRFSPDGTRGCEPGRYEEMCQFLQKTRFENADTFPNAPSKFLWDQHGQNMTAKISKSLSPDKQMTPQATEANRKRKGHPDTRTNSPEPPKPIPKPKPRGKPIDIPTNAPKIVRASVEDLEFEEMTRPERAIHESGGVRRSARVSAAAAVDNPGPSKFVEKPDELILVYPPTGAGAVNITNGDVARLEPGEFLNDTLIEFGLKYWLAKLRKSNPELADQVYIFSSFFYKKLNKKNFDEGYKSIKKWTKDIDVFNKRFLVVPINEHMHWYLAIIYQPEHVLTTPPPPILRDTRSRLTKAPPTLTLTISTTTTLLQETGEPLSSPTKSSEKDATEVDALMKATDSCSTNGDQAEKEEAYEGNQVYSPMVDTAFFSSVAGSTGAEVGESMDMEVDIAPVSDPSPLTEREDGSDDDKPMEGGGPSRRIVSEEEGDEDVEMVDHPVPTPASQDVEIIGMGVPANSFYAKTPSKSKSSSSKLTPPTSKPPSSVEETRASESNSKTYSKKDKGKQRADPNAIVIDASPGRKKEEEVEINSEFVSELDIQSVPDGLLNQTWIFTLDSLGGGHKQVHNMLTKYLKAEALDKKGLAQTSEPQKTNAAPPSQPNFCDCGVYLLHFAKTFVENSDRLVRLTIASMSKRGTMPNDERVIHWDGSNIMGYRKELLDITHSLSKEWKEMKAAADEKKRRDREEGKDIIPVESSDDEVEVVETEKKPTTKKKPAARVR